MDKTSWALLFYEHVCARKVTFAQDCCQKMHLSCFNLSLLLSPAADLASSRSRGNLFGAMDKQGKKSLVCRLMRNHLPAGGPTRASFLVTDPEKITDNFEHFVLELCLIKNMRKTARFLAECAAESFPRLERAECQLFGQRIFAACEHIYVKKKSMTSGRKLHPSVHRIIEGLNAADEPDETPVSKISRKSSLASSSSRASGSKDLPSSFSLLPMEKSEKKQSVANFYKEMLADSSMDEENAESEECVADDIVSISSSEAMAEETIECPKFQQFESTSDMALIRLHPDGSRQVAQMSTGATGFAVAKFEGSDNEHVSEIPNSTLLLYQNNSKNMSLKRPAAAPKQAVAKKTLAKRPAAVVAETSGTSQKRDAIHLQAANDQYCVMVYKNGSWAIRKRGGSQLFAIPKRNKTDEEMLAHVKEAVQRLTNGESISFVRDWARA